MSYVKLFRKAPKDANGIPAQMVKVKLVDRDRAVGLPKALNLLYDSIIGEVTDITGQADELASYDLWEELN